LKPLELFKLNEKSFDSQASMLKKNVLKLFGTFRIFRNSC
jgi:hypothetical protein